MTIVIVEMIHKLENKKKMKKRNVTSDVVTSISSEVTVIFVNILLIISFSFPLLFGSSLYLNLFVLRKC